MKPLFNTEELTGCSGNVLFLLECERCHKPFSSTAAMIRAAIKRKGKRLSYCSKDCVSESRRHYISFICRHCGISFVAIKGSRKRTKKTKSNDVFCSQSCSATYHNIHKTTGTRRSKLEQWLEQALTAQYPDMEFIFNGKEAINSELDIYIPKLKLAFELNGIFHYEPIYGPEKLASIQNNDNRKFQACLEQGIELVIIDSSSMKDFKSKNAQKYLNVITKIITLKSMIDASSL